MKLPTIPFSISITALALFLGIALGMALPNFLENLEHYDNFGWQTISFNRGEVYQWEVWCSNEYADGFTLLERACLDGQSEPPTGSTGYILSDDTCVAVMQRVDNMSKCTEESVEPFERKRAIVATHLCEHGENCIPLGDGLDRIKEAGR